MLEMVVEFPCTRFVIAMKIGHPFSSFVAFQRHWDMHDSESARQSPKATRQGESRVCDRQSPPQAGLGFAQGDKTDRPCESL